VLEDSTSNVIAERFDLLRVGRLPDTGLHSIEIGRCRILVCAAPAFLRSRAPPREPADLLQLPWVSITQLPHPDELCLVHASSGQRVSLRLQVAIKTHSGIAAREFIRNGAGVGLLPDYSVVARARPETVTTRQPSAVRRRRRATHP